MNFRNARKFAIYLHRKRLTRYNIWKRVISTRHLNFSNKKRKYFCRWREGNVSRIRSHRCAWKLVVILNRLMKIPHRCQQTDMYGKREQISGEGLAFPVVPTGVVGNRFMTDRKKKDIPKIDKKIQNIIDEVGSTVDQDLWDRVNNNWYYSEEADRASQERAMKKIGSRPPKETDRLIQFMGFVRAVCHMPKTDGKILTHDVNLSFEAQADVNATSSSCGYVLVHHGNKLASKRNAKVFTLYNNEHDRLSKNPRIPPHKTFKKHEVLKKGKDPRTIQIQSDTDYKIDSLLSHGYPNPGSGSAIGMNSRGGFLQLFCNWYYHWDSGTWTEFLDFLSKQKAHESDKTGWDSSTNANDGVPFLIFETMHYGLINKGDKPLLVRALANYANPLIELGSNTGFYAKWRVPSGTERTSFGNTTRHQIMNWVVCDLFSLRGCGCNVCKKVEKVNIDYKLIELRRNAMIMGDDYGSVSWGEEGDRLFDTTVDKLYGTQTKTETKEFFSAPGLAKTNSFEFLRNHFCIDHNNVIIPYRDAERMLAKLCFGAAARANPERMLQSVRSAMLECGGNEKLFDILKSIAVRVSDLVEEEEEYEDNQTPEMVGVIVRSVTFDHIYSLICQFANHFMQAYEDADAYHFYRVPRLNIE